MAGMSFCEISGTSERRPGELPLPDHLDGHRGLRNDGGRPGTVVEEGDLAYVRSRSSGRDHAVTLADLDLTVEHDDELVAGRAFAYEDGSGRLFERRRELRDELQLLLRKPLEQRHLGQLLLDPIVTVHRTSSFTRPGHCAVDPQPPK